MIPLGFRWLFYVCQINVSVESCNYDLLGLKYEVHLSCWNFNYLLSNGNIYSLFNQNKPQNKYVCFFALSQEPPTNGGGGRKYSHILYCLIFFFQQCLQNYSFLRLVNIQIYIIYMFTIGNFYAQELYHKIYMEK